MKKRKDGRYQKKITINGKPVFFYGKTMAELNQNILNYQERKDAGEYFKVVAEMWERKAYPDIAHQTAVRYHTLTKHAVNEFGEMSIKNITAKDIELFLNRLAAQGYAAKTIKDQASVIGLIFRFALVERLIEQNPMGTVSLPKKGRKPQKREALTETEVAVVENGINCTFGLLAYFLLYTGCRKGEALALQWQDIDFKNKRIIINKTVYYMNNAPYIKEPKTDAGMRQIILLDKLAEKLHPGKPDEYIFPGKDGKLMPSSYFTRRWDKWEEETGLKVTAHQLRHTFTTLLFEAGIDVKDAQVLMGHSDIQTTRNIYTHVRESRMRSTENLLNNFVNSNK